MLMLVRMPLFALGAPISDESSPLTAGLALHGMQNETNVPAGPVHYCLRCSDSVAVSLVALLVWHIYTHGH